MLLAVNQVAGVECRQLEPVSMGNSVGGASLNAVSAKNAAVVIDVVNLGVALGPAYAILGGILGGFNIDAVRRASRGAQKTGHALLQPVFVALQNVGATKSRFNPRSP